MSSQRGPALSAEIAMRLQRASSGPGHNRLVALASGIGFKASPDFPGTCSCRPAGMRRMGKIDRLLPASISAPEPAGTGEKSVARREAPQVSAERSFAVSLLTVTVFTFMSVSE